MEGAKETVINVIDEEKDWNDSNSIDDIQKDDSMYQSEAKDGMNQLERNAKIEQKNTQNNF